MSRLTALAHIPSSLVHSFEHHYSWKTDEEVQRLAWWWGPAPRASAAT